MAVETWLDEITKRWELVSNGKGGTIYSYRCYEKEEFPESLSNIPCALTYITEVRYDMSEGLRKGYYKGITEFHLFTDAKKSNLPALQLYFVRVRNAAAGKVALNGTVDHFYLRKDVPGIQPGVLKYGGEDPHHGLIVNWEVKADEGQDVGYVFAL